MRDPVLTSAAAWLCCALVPAAAWAEPPDPRLREVWYDPQAVVTVPVKRGIVTDIVLDAGEAITDVASGLGGDCSKPEASWCIAAQPGGRHLFVKPKSTASAANNLAVVTDKRTQWLEIIERGGGIVGRERRRVREQPRRGACREGRHTLEAQIQWLNR